MSPEYQTVDQAFRTYVSLYGEAPSVAETVNQDALVFILNAKHIYMIVPVGAEIILGRLHPTNITQPELELSAYDAEAAGVSRLHAALRHEKNGWWLIDMNSANGTWVNGERLAPFVPHALSATNQVFLANLDISILLPEAQ